MDQPPRALSLDRLAAIPLLVSAWEHVERSDATDGVVAPSVARFASNAERHLEELHDELVTGSYRPRPLTPVRIPKRRGTYRELHIPSARDRVVERALQQVIDPTLSFSSYGYRPGLGVLTAARRAASRVTIRYSARVDTTLAEARARLGFILTADEQFELLTTRLLGHRATLGTVERIANKLWAKGDDNPSDVQAERNRDMQATITDLWHTEVDRVGPNGWQPSTPSPRSTSTTLARTSTGPPSRRIRDLRRPNRTDRHRSPSQLNTPESKGTTPTNPSGTTHR